MKLQTVLTISELEKSSNIATLLSEEDLTVIAQQVIHDYQIDLDSRSDWEQRNADALKLALQVKEEKTYPWPGAANIKFPLVTVAALQSHAREYPALLSGTEIVKCRVIGKDVDGIKTERAKRVSTHMSYQILEEDTNWEEEMDKVLITKPITGTAFKKIFFDASLGHNVSEMILAQNLVIPYYAKSLEKATRITHRIDGLSKNDIYERVARGVFIDCLDKLFPTVTPQTPLKQASDDAQGRREVAGDEDAPIILLEQHRYLDLDGDGYAEPYIVTVAEDYKTVLRIVARYFKTDITYKGNKILHITPQHFFVKYGMIPSPDGGIYDLGFGALLGPLNDTVNTLINQLIDAGTLNNLGGGFLGRGAKLRRGQNSFVPGEWKQVDSAGADLKNSVVPLPIKEPSQVLFALLGMLVNYSERISGATDIMSGENVGQNTPASTAQELVKQGSVIFNSIFKRTYRSLKAEFRMLYRLNGLYLENQVNYENLTNGDAAMVLLEDYAGPETDVRPSADPNVSSVEQKMQQAIFLKQASTQGPGYKPMAVEKRLLDAANIPYQAEVWDEKNVPQPQPDVKLQIKQMEMQVRMMEMKANMQLKAAELLQEQQKIGAEILELQARAYKQIKEANGVDADNIVNLINAQIAARKTKQDGIIQTVKTLTDLMAMSKEGEGSARLSNETDAGGMAGMAETPMQQGSEGISGISTGGTETAMG